MTGPVTQALQQEVLSEARQCGLLVWLDKEGEYDGFVADLSRQSAAGDLSIPVLGFQGSFLELMVELESAACGVDNTPLIVHMPGFNEDSIKLTPVFELYRAGKRYRRSLDTLVRLVATGAATPDEIENFLQSGNVTLESADAWLTSCAARKEGGLTAHLMLSRLPALLDDLLDAGPLSDQLTDPAALDILWDHLHRHTGMSPAWRAFAGVPDEPEAADLAHALAGWALCVEYVHDLQRKPFESALTPLVGLTRPLVDTCGALATHMRQRRPRTYVRIADTVEELLHDEMQRGSPEDLGRIDTFREEEKRMLRAALDALGQDRWDTVAAWATERLGSGSFWVERSRARQYAWQLLAEAAQLGQSIEGARQILQGVSGLEEAVGRYQERGAVVDRAHRLLEQMRARLLSTHLPHYDELRDRLDHLRECYRAWADELAEGFTVLCEAQGFVATESLQQRHLFEQVVRPLVNEDRTALFMVDALRYEMVEALKQEIEAEAGTRLDLRARLAELPTTTGVGMNALAPVTISGRLRPVISGKEIRGFHAGEFQVIKPERRQQMMASRVGGDTSPMLSLAEVLRRDATSLRLAVARARLVIVHSTELDAAGESGTGLSSFENVLQQIRSAWSLLRDAGIRRFVFTADHGFLLLDGTTHTSEAFGSKVDPAPRYAIYPEAQNLKSLVSVSMASLGYDDAPGYLVFPRTTALFDRGRDRRCFVHGGSSLQERVIPVLVVRHDRDTGGGSMQYTVEAETRDGVAGMHCVQLKVTLAPGGTAPMAFGGPRQVDLALRVPDRPDVAVQLCGVRHGVERGAAVVAEVDQPCEVFFRLVGRAAERLPVEVWHPGAREDIEPTRLLRRYTVEGTGALVEKVEGAAVPAAGALDWLDDLPDEGTRRLFDHLARHGSASEAEVTTMLGSPRKVRRLAVQFDEILGRVPFEVHIETTPTGKRFVRKGEG